MCVGPSTSKRLAVNANDFCSRNSTPTMYSLLGDSSAPESTASLVRFSKVGSPLTLVASG